MIGEHIGNFQIVSQLGSGGMGDVFLAEQMEIHTKVAIKLLHANISNDRTHIQRFFNEAVAVSKIKHAGIVRIFDVGFTGTGRAYLIMEFLEGETLAKRIANAGRLTIADVADIGRQTAGVLAATHAEGVVHRDLKPDNIYLVSDAEMARGERVKILDFGIAKLSNTNLTGSANSMGTPTYMAPEQWNHSGGVDWRADAYSLGCLAFEMCTGRPPFIAMSIGEACAMHLGEPPPSARSFVPDIPPALDALLMRMLAKKPEDRPASMAEIAAGFSAHADTPTGPMYVVGAPTGAIGAALSPTMPTGPGAHVSAPLPTAVVEPKRGGRGLLLGLGGVVLVGGAAAAVVLATRHHDAPAAHRDAGHVAAGKDAGAPADAALAVATVDAGSAAGSGTPNPWVDIAPPAKPVALGVDSDSAPETERGFRPARKIFAPSVAYAIQAHEVTWSELEPYLAAHALTIEFPAWAKDAATRARLPATNVTWQLAHDYCVSIKGELPSDEEWEYAARGAERRPNSWGADRLDRRLTHTLVGDAGTPNEVMKSEQDKTPGPPGTHHLFDLTGNVQEWTEGLWRDDTPSKKPEDEAWVEDGDTSFRALRGLPLRGDPKTKIQLDAAAYREPACATPPCNGKLVPALETVGFRCVQSARTLGKSTQTAVGPGSAGAAPHGKPDAGVAGAVDAAVVAAPPQDAAAVATDDCTLDSCQAIGMEGACCSRKFPKKPPPRAVPAAPDKAEVDATFAKLTQKVRGCATEFHAHGAHKVTLHIAPNGHISGVVMNTQIPRFKECVEAAAANLTVGASQTGATVSSTITLPRGASTEP